MARSLQAVSIERAPMALYGDPPTMTRGQPHAGAQEESLADNSVRICLFGAVGHNIGDESVAIATLDELRARFPSAQFALASRRPRATAHATGIPTFLGGQMGMASAWRQLRRSTHLLVGGGTLIQDALYAGVPWKGTMPSAVLVAEIARRMAIPVASVSIGVEPLGSRINQNLARRLVSGLDPLIVRDASSAQVLTALGTPNEMIHVAADPAFLLSEEELQPSVKALLRSPYVAVSVLRENLLPENYREAFVRACLAAVHGGRQLVFVPMDDRVNDDLAEVNSILAALKLDSSDYLVLSPSTPAKQVAWLLRRAETTLAMRLHAMILSLGLGARVVGISRASKTDVFLRRYSDAPAYSAHERLGPSQLANEVAQTLGESIEQRRERTLRQRRLVEEDRIAARSAFDLLASWLQRSSRQRAID